MSLFNIYCDLLRPSVLTPNLIQTFNNSQSIYICLTFSLDITLQKVFLELFLQGNEYYKIHRDFSISISPLQFWVMGSFLRIHCLMSVCELDDKKDKTHLK